MAGSTLDEPSCPVGPLAGLRVVEITSIGPGPHCAMLLADLGAEVLRIDKPGGNGWPNPVVDRGRSTVECDIRSEPGRLFLHEAVGRADVLIEGFRPGVMERLGFGPDVVCEANPRLVYGRMTGWGQTGPLAQSAGHDINYIAVTGALAAIGMPGMRAVPPLNLVGDFGGGSLFLAFGILAALFERERSGRGQVVDAAIVDGVTSLMANFSGLSSSNRISMERDKNILAGVAPYYSCYECADGREIAVGPLEPQFYRTLLERSGGPRALLDRQHDVESWSDDAGILAELFLSRSRDEWCELLQDTDACFAPVLALSEAPGHHHLAARGTYVAHDGQLQAAPAPRFSRTPGSVPSARPTGAELVRSWTEASAAG